MNRFGRRSGRGVHIGVQSTDAMMEIVLIDGVISFGHVHDPVPGDRQDPKVIASSPSHIRYERRVQLVKHDARNPRPATGRIISTPDGLKASGNTYGMQFTSSVK